MEKNKQRKGNKALPEQEDKDMNEFEEFEQLLFKFWDGEITEQEFEKQRPNWSYISKEIDEEMQQDRFY